MTETTIIVTGSLAYDQILNLPGKFSSYILPDKIHNINVSFVTDTHIKLFGGTGANQAYSLALLGIPPILVGTAGTDFGPYKTFLEKNNITTSYIKIIDDELTALGIAITDEKDNQIWGFSKGAMKFARDLSLTPILKRLKGKNEKLFVAITPNDPLAIARYIDECIEEQIDFSFDPAFYIPTLTKEALKKGIHQAHVVFGNDYEIALLRKKIGVRTETFKSKHGQFLVTTLGEKGSDIVYADADGTIEFRKHIKPAKVTNIIDPTGAGDAYRSGFLAGFLNGKDIQICGQMGSIAAAYAIENYGTMKHSYSVIEFWKRYEQNYGSLK